MGRRTPCSRSRWCEWKRLSEGKYEVGALYRPKAGGAEVRLVGLETVKSKITGGGARYRFSDGQVLGMLELISKFEFLGRGSALGRGQ